LVVISSCQKSDNKDITRVSREEFTKSYKLLSSKTSPSITACIEQNSNVVKKAYKDVEVPVNGDEFFVFETNEKLALHYIKSFDVKKSVLSRFYDFSKFILDNCLVDGEELFDIDEYEKIRQLKSLNCNLFDVADFMKSLIYATKSHGWSDSTINAAKEKIFEFIYYTVSSERLPTIQKMISLSLLEWMVDYSLIDKKHTALIKKTVKEVDKKTKELSKAYYKKDRKGLSRCERHKVDHESELLIANEVTRYINKILNSL
jgi:hypothetical protein